MMQRILIAALAAALSLGPVWADYVIKDGNGTSQTIKSNTVGGKILPQSTPTDSSGTEIVPATQATLTSILAKITSDPATQTTAAAILAKLSADPATQTTLAAFLSANHVDLAAILAKLTSDPATQTTLAAVLAKLTSDPSTATLQATTNTNLGAPGATACATDTGSCSGNALWQRIAQRVTSLITALGTPLQAGGNVVVTSAPTTTVTGTVGLSTQGYTASASITRTNDTNAYTANDVIGAATGSTAGIQFSSIGASGGDIVVTSVELEIDAAAIISGETSYNLYLYNVTPPSALGDNVAFDIPSGDRASFVGKIALGTPVDEGSTLYIRTDGVNAHVKLSSANLFGYLVTVGAYTPTASRVYKVTLHAAGL